MLCFSLRSPKHTPDRWLEAEENTKGEKERSWKCSQVFEIWEGIPGPKNPYQNLNKQK